jgi:tRNA(Ile)-lysidine synthase
VSVLPAHAVDRFRADLDAVSLRAVGGTVSGGGLIALAVSGGPDSMAMLALAVAACPGDVVAATVDHQLRAESTQESVMVAAACEGLGVPHTILIPDEPITGSSTQMRAREARYRALAQWAESAGAYPLLTAHHADDQAETLLMRLNRASGISGLACVRPYHLGTGRMILRPLLTWRRAELRAIVETAELPFVTDPSNTDSRYDRTRVRTLLADNPDLDASALAASAGFLLEAEAVIANLAQLHWSEAWDGRTNAVVLDDLPRELRRRLVRRAISEIRTINGIVLPVFSEAANIEPLLDSMETGRGAVHGGVQAHWNGEAWHFRPAPPRRAT